jgi:hypothetical protein
MVYYLALAAFGANVRVYKGALKQYVYIDCHAEMNMS